MTEPLAMPNNVPSPAGIASGDAAPAKLPSLRRNYTLMLLGNVIYTGCQWAMLMVLAKLTHPEQVGQFGLGLAVVGPVILFAGLQLRSIQATDAHERYRFGDYLLLRLLCIICALVAITFIVLLSKYDTETRLIILVVGFAKSVEAMSDVYYGFFQQFERMGYIAVSMIIKGISSIAALWFCVYQTRSVLYGCIGLTLTWLIVFLCYDVPCARFLARTLREGDYRQLLALRYDFRLLWQITWLALPLGGVMMLISLSSNLPRYYLVNYQGHGGYAIGIFSALYSLLVAGSTIAGAFGQAATPRLAHLYADKDYSGFYLLLKKLLFIGVLIGAVGILVAVTCGHFLLLHLFKPVYACYLHEFILVMVGAAILYLAAFLGYGLTAARILKSQLPLLCVVTLVTLLGAWWLIPRGGIAGAAGTVIVSSSALLLGSLFLLLRSVPYLSHAAKGDSQ